MTTAHVQTITFEQVLTLAQQLPPKEQARLVVRLAPMLEQSLDQAPAPPMQLRGIWSHFTLIPTEKDIAEVRREMLANFPSEDL